MSPSWWKRYEPLLEAKAVPAKEAVMDLMAKELCEICEAFPPRASDVGWEDPRKQARFAPILEDLPRVSLDQADLLGRIVALDLAHEIDAIDHLFRNRHHKEACPTKDHEEALHFLWPLMVEVLLARKEELQGLLKGKDLVEVAERFRRRFRERRMLLQ